MDSEDIGRPYVLGITFWVTGSDYVCRGNEYELKLFLARPLPAQVGAVQHGPCEFAVTIFDEVLFFLYRFGDGVPWGHSPYAWRCVPEEERTPPEPIELDSARLRVIFVDATTGIVRAVRVVELSLSTSGHLYRAIRNQMDREDAGSISYDDIVLLTRTPRVQTADLLSRAVTTCRGKDVEVLTET